MDVQVNGADGFYKLSKALKHGGHAQLRKDLTREMAAPAKTLIPKTREAAATELPQRGGLAKQVAKAPQRVQVRTGDLTAGVRIVVSKRAGARATNRGELRHPVFPRPDQDRKDWVWVTQTVPAGWFDKTIEQHVLVVVPGCEKALDLMVERIVKEVGGGL